MAFSLVRGTGGDSHGAKPWPSTSRLLLIEFTITTVAFSRPGHHTTLLLRLISHAMEDVVRLW
jgi:hypothetical protein